MNKKYIFITTLCIVFSIISGILAKDLIIGGTILATGLLCSYFASEGKCTYFKQWRFTREEK